MWRVLCAYRHPWAKRFPRAGNNVRQQASNPRGRSSPELVQPTGAGTKRGSTGSQTCCWLMTSETTLTNVTADLDNLRFTESRHLDVIDDSAAHPTFDRIARRFDVPQHHDRVP